MDLTPDPNLSVQRVGKYELLRKLGQGGMAEVFLARRTGIEGFAHLCVVKTILPQFASDPDFVEMFFDEARITVELQHTNIVRVFDLDRDGEFVYLAMEFVDGMDALSLMVDCEELGVTVPFGPLLYIISETLRGLLHAHMAADISGRPLGLIHRDISPGNILLGINGAVKLSDFGVARASISRRSEEPGMLVGKMRYFAPELLLGEDATQQSDIFAVGTCMYEMLAMQPLFPPADTIIQQALYVRDWSVDALIEQHLNFPDGVDEILRRALAKDPANRYQTAQHFLEDCIDLAHESQIRLGDIAMISFIKELRKAALEPAPHRDQPTTRFRDESHGGASGTAPEVLSGIPPAGQGVSRGEESWPEESWPEEPHRDTDSTDALRRALTQVHGDNAPPPPPPPETQANAFPSDDRLFQATGIVTPQRHGVDQGRVTYDPEVSVDEPSIMETSLPVVLPGQPERVPRLADVLSNPQLGESRRLPDQPGTTLQFRMVTSTMVELFTHRGRLGPYTAKMVSHAADKGRLSGIELISVDSAPWEPLFNFLANASPEQRRRIKSFDFVRLGPLLLHWTRKAGRFETILWSGSGATYLGIAEGRVCAAATYPPLRKQQHAAAQGVARAMSWPRGGALGISAPHLHSNPSDPLLTKVLLQAVGDSLPPHQLRRMASSHKNLRLRILPEATTAVDRVQGFGSRARALVRQRQLELQKLGDEDLRDAVKLVALGLAKAVRKR